jgi:UDP-galactopyranose mutase
LSWGGGEAGCLNPFRTDCGFELKKQLVRANLAAIDAVWSEIPGARVVQIDPMIHITADPQTSSPEYLRDAEMHRQYMFQAWDMISGRLCPELGGHESYLDIVGVNYYVQNQWLHHDCTIYRGHRLYRPVSLILREIYERYHKPLFIAETGIEDELRAAWLAYVCDEVADALRMRVPVEGVCIYPLLNHPGWLDGRHCYNGLFDYCDDCGDRGCDEPFAGELLKQAPRMEALWDALEHHWENGFVPARSKGVETTEKTMKLDTNWLSKPAGDLLCLSHLRWGFVYQRPQHLISRFAKSKRVFFVEEPVPTDGTPGVDIHVCPETGVNICVPRIPQGLSPETAATIQKLLLNNLIGEQAIRNYILWYYTPMALDFSRHLEPRLTVFDCMDELSAFAGAPIAMKQLEAEMLRRADIVFTGGMSLYEAKKDRHSEIHCFPSSVDVPHFAQGRSVDTEPTDQKDIPRPRIGFCGVIDERLDRDLLDGIARLRPDWQFVMLGPVVKIDPASLPHHPNVHYLGGKSYKELPQYLGGWDVAMLPFAHNDSTRFISPTKTPEYLAAGKPVVSTSITDVVRPYGQQKLVHIADTPEEFVAACEAAMRDATNPAWHASVDTMLANMSWDLTWEKMNRLIEEKLAATQIAQRSAVFADFESAVSGD